MAPGTKKEGLAIPYYYDITLPITTNSAAGVESTGAHLTLRNGGFVTAMVKGCYVNAQSGTAGGGKIRAKTAGTNAASSSGTTVTPARRHPSNPVAVTSALSTQTNVGAGLTQRFSIGFAQTGGMGGWVAIEPDAAIQLVSTGAFSTTNTTGNMDITSIANAASVPIDLTVEFSEL